jgi:Secretion system C-terminal sorting domain
MKKLYVIALLFVVNFCFANTLIVTNVNDNGAGSLRNQITAAMNGDDIIFSPSLIASGSATITLLTDIVFSKSLSINGLYNSSDTLFISGGNTNRLFFISNTSEVTLDSLCFINGYASDGGGAILSSNVRFLTLTNCLFRNNNVLYPYRGGGILFTGYTTSPTDLKNLTVNNCKFDSNSSQYGGGISINTNGNYSNIVRISNSIIKNNTALYGGGVFYDNYTDSVTNVVPFVISNSTIEGNDADYGGGISTSCYGYANQSMTIQDCRIANNGSSGIFYGGYSETPAVLLVDGCEIDNNENGLKVANYSDSAIAISIKVKKSTLSNHQSPDLGSAIFTSCTAESLVELEIEQSTIDGNTTTSFGSIVAYTSNPNLISNVRIKNSTITNNRAAPNSGPSDFASIFLASPNINLSITSSIVSLNFPGDIGGWDPFTVASGGFNIFGDAIVTGSLSSDRLLIDSTELNLGELAYNGNLTKTRIPLLGSVAIGAGNPIDLTPAQNASIVSVRDIGAAESIYDVTGLENSSRETDFITVYPNPTTDIISIASVTKIDTLALYSLEGKILMKVINGSVLNMEKLPAGSYVLQIYTEEGFVSKFVSKL